MTMPVDAFMSSCGAPGSRGRAPAPGRSERLTALFRVFVFEAADGDIKCEKEDEKTLMNLMVKASKGSNPITLSSFASFNARALPASKKKSRKSQLRVTCGLVAHPLGRDANRDERLGGAAALFCACGFTLSDGTKVKLVDDVASILCEMLDALPSHRMIGMEPQRTQRLVAATLAELGCRDPVRKAGGCSVLQLPLQD